MVQSVTHRPLQIAVRFQGHPEMQVPVSLYAFTPNGQFLAQAPFVNGIAELLIADDQARKARLLIAPPIETEEVTLRRVERMQPYQPVWTFHPEQRHYELNAIPAAIARGWVVHPVRVRGEVVRPVHLGGITVGKPVAFARVHVCEVDPVVRMISRLSDIDLLSLRLTVLDLPAIANASLPPGVLAALQSEMPNQIRLALMKLADLIRANLNALPWLTMKLQVDEVAVLVTDHFGQFDVTFNHFPFEDQPDPVAAPYPDLYFWVEFPVGGAWTPVYKKDVALDTHWEYRGQPVTLRITDARVPWQEDPRVLNGHEVAVTFIGNQINVADIQTHGPNMGLTRDGRPFGGTLEPQVIFGRELIEKGALYRWSYRKLNADDPWHVIDTPVVRHYAIAQPDGTLAFRLFLLGPELLPVKQPKGQIVQGPAFQIQPMDPPEGMWYPGVDLRMNLAAAMFRTELLDGGNAAAAAGLYELKLEVFEKDGTPAKAAFKLPVANEKMDRLELVDAPAELLVRDAHHQTTGFRMVLRIDNTPVAAEIFAPIVDNTPAEACGFLSYPAPTEAHTPTARIAFRAHHPHNFATFAMELKRGGTIVEATQAPATGLFSLNIPVPQLLGDCTVGAFAEVLHVHATATDGWNRLAHLDREATAAFALYPHN